MRLQRHSQERAAASLAPEEHKFRALWQYIKVLIALSSRQWREASNNIIQDQGRAKQALPANQ
jgi:hypothetical protein